MSTSLSSRSPSPSPAVQSTVPATTDDSSPPPVTRTTEETLTQRITTIRRTTTTTTDPPTTTTTTTIIPTTIPSPTRVATTIMTLPNGQITVIFSTDPGTTQPNNSNAAAILGGVVGGFFLLVIIAGGVLFLLRRKGTQGFRFKSNNHFDLGTFHPNAKSYQQSTSPPTAPSPIVPADIVARNSVIMYNGYLPPTTSIIVTEPIQPNGQMYGYGQRQSVLITQPAYVIDPRTGETYLSSNGQLPEGFQYLTPTSVVQPAISGSYQSDSHLRPQSQQFIVSEQRASMFSAISSDQASLDTDRKQV